MQAVLLIAMGSLCAAVIALLAARAANGVVDERRRRALLDAEGAEDEEDADCEVPVEEGPRLMNQRRVERILDSRVWWARIRQVPGPVVLRYRITAQGRPVEPSVIRSSGSHAFDTTVMRALRHARFQPARVNGWPVAVWVEQPFAFRAPADRG